MFQGTGYGIRSMIVSINRTIIMQVLFSYLYVFAFNIGLNGVWWGDCNRKCNFRSYYIYMGDFYG
jgi:Na+-driven multidrug efflux pump